MPGSNTIKKPIKIISMYGEKLYEQKSKIQSIGAKSYLIVSLELHCPYFDC
jgi:hypothetical protein